MKVTRLLLSALVCQFLATLSFAATINVSGKANLWLAGWANGTTATGGDSAPAQSPVLFTPVTPHEELTFTVTGTAGVAPGAETGPDGDDSEPVTHFPENQLSGIASVPANALVGIFLDDNVPFATNGQYPPILVYDATERDKTTRMVNLREPFYIGDGRNSAGVKLKVVVPDRATRLFLGIMDSSGWNDNVGSFNVDVRGSVLDTTAPTLAIAHVYVENSGTDKVVKFDLDARDENALPPGGLINEILESATEYRYRIGTGAFSDWSKDFPYNRNNPPTLTVPANVTLDFEARATDVAGNVSDVASFSLPRFATSNPNPVGPNIGPENVLPAAATQAVFLSANRDVDGDGTNDILVVDNTFKNIETVLNKTGNMGTFSTYQASLGTGTVLSAAIGDFRSSASFANNDALPDVVALFADSLKVFANTADSVSHYFTPVATLTDEAQAILDGSLLKQVVAGDINGDGYDDIVALAQMNTDTRVLVFLNSTSGFPSTPSHVYSAHGLDLLTAVAVGDINADGFADAIVGGRKASGVSLEDQALAVFNGAETGELSAAGSAPEINGEIMAITLADILGHTDGIRDFVLTLARPYDGNTYQENWQVVFNRGDGTYGQSPLAVLDAHGYAEVTDSLEPKTFGNAVVADMNGDGIPNIVSSSYGPGGPLSTGGSIAIAQRVFLPDGSGTSQTADGSVSTVASAPYTKTRRVAVGDLNGDGKPDVVLARDGIDNNLAYRLNNTYFPAQFPTAGEDPNSPLITSPKLVKIVPGGATSGVRGLSQENWTFTYALTKDNKIAGLVLKLQMSTDNGNNWTDVPGGTLTPNAAKSSWAVTLSDLPVTNALLFRALAVPPLDSGRRRASSVASAAYTVIGSPKLAVTVRAKPESDPSQNRFTHNNEFIDYDFEVTNVGDVAAANATLAVGVPKLTSTTTGGFAGWQPIANKNTGFSYSFGSIAVGATVTKSFITQVLNDALKKGGKDPLVRLASATEPLTKTPPTTVGMFLTRMVSLTAYGTVCDAPAAGFKPVTSSGAAAVTPILPALGIEVIPAFGDVQPGDIMTYTLRVKNYSAQPIQNIVVTDVLEPDSFLDQVEISSSQTSGPFNISESEPTTGTNPKFDRNQQLLTWTVGTLAGGSSIDLIYRAGIRYGRQPGLISLLDPVTRKPRTFILGANVQNSGFSASGTQSSTTGAIVARPDRLPIVELETTDVGAPQPPQIGFVKQATTTAWNGSVWVADPDAEIRADGEDVAAVPEGGFVRYTLHYFVTGESPARRCVITDEIPEGAILYGYIQRNGNSIDNLVEYYDKTGKLLPVATTTGPAQVFLQKQTRRIQFVLGNLNPGDEGVITYVARAATLGANATAPDKLTTAGKYLISQEYQMQTDSLVLPSNGRPSQVPAYVVRPVSFDIESRPDAVGQIDVPAGTTKTVTYLISYRNNGSVAAKDVVINAQVPSGATFKDAHLLDGDLNPTASSFTPDSKGKVVYTIGNVPGNSEGLWQGHVRLRVDVTNTATTKFPKDFRLVQTVEIGGKDSVSDKPAVGTYKLASVSGGVKTAQDVGVNISQLVINPYATGGKLFAGKTAPQFAKPGELIKFSFFFGNSGDQPLTNVVAAILVPPGTTFEKTGSTPGFPTTVGTKAGTKIVWNFPVLAAHEAKGMNFFARVNSNAEYNGKALVENSLVVEGTTGTAPRAVKLSVAPGATRTVISSQNAVASAWEWLGQQLSAFGSNLFGKGSAGVAGGVTTYNSASLSTIIRGADAFALTNGALIVPLGGGQIVASGGGNLIANDGASLIANDGASVVAAGAGNVIAAGAGNLISVNSVGYCSTANLNSLASNIVAGGAGNIIAAGGGNLIANDGASLLANDGASLGPISINAASIVAAGGGNIVASGGGNIVAAGGGNIVAAGGGNFAENLLATRPGAALITNPNAHSLIIESGASRILSDQGGGLIANDGAGLIANDGASLIQK